MSDLWSATTLETIGTAALGGAIGGLASLMTPAAKARKATLVLARLLVGAAAAIGFLWLASPEGSVAIWGASIVAGFGGEAILDVLKERAVEKVNAAELEAALETAIGTPPVAGDELMSPGQPLVDPHAGARKVLERVRARRP